MTGLVVSQSSPVLGISMAWIYSSLPVGGIIFSLFVLQSLVENVRGFLKKTA